MEETKDYNITPVQFGSLVAIGDHPGIDATRLSDLISFDCATIGSVISRLEAKSLITRAADPDDKRVKRIHLTEEGRRMVEAITAREREVNARILAPLKPEDQKALLDLLATLVDIRQVGY